MCIFGLLAGSVGTGTPACALGGDQAAMGRAPIRADRRPALNVERTERRRGRVGPTSPNQRDLVSTPTAVQHPATDSSPAADPAGADVGALDVQPRSSNPPGSAPDHAACVRPKGAGRRAGANGPSQQSENAHS